MDISPIIQAGRQIVESYGDGRIRVSGVVWTAPLLVRPERSLNWDWPGALADVRLESLLPLFEPELDIELLLVGCGPRMQPFPLALRQALKSRFGTVVETMDTGAACRTYAVLMAEDRRVGAALLPV